MFDWKINNLLLKALGQHPIATKKKKKKSRLHVCSFLHWNALSSKTVKSILLMLEAICKRNLRDLGPIA